MHHRNQARTSRTQHILKWCLKIGTYQGTLSTAKLPRKLGVKRTTLTRWLNGSLAVPENILQNIRHCAVAPYRTLSLRSVIIKQPRLPEQLIATNYEWMTMIFEQMNILSKRKFCNKLRKNRYFLSKPGASPANQI